MPQVPRGEALNKNQGMFPNPQLSLQLRHISPNCTLQEKAITSSTVAQAAPAPTVLQLLGTIASDSRAVLAQRSAQLIFLASAFRFCAGTSPGDFSELFSTQCWCLEVCFGSPKLGTPLYNGFTRPISAPRGIFLLTQKMSLRRKLWLIYI